MPHHIWSSVRNNVHDSRRAQLKCRLLTGIYTLQSNRAVFNQFAVDPMCKICGTAPETRQHFLVECHYLQEVRHDVYMKIQCVTDLNFTDTISNGDAVQLIRDPSVFFKNKTVIDKVELYSRELVSNLHRIRTKLLLEKERQQGLSSSELNSSVDCFSKSQKP